MPGPDYSIGLTKRAAENYGRLPKAEKKKVDSWVKRAKQNPTAGASTLVKVRPLIWKKRLGDIRVLFGVFAEERVVKVGAILWRREDTYSEASEISSEVHEGVGNADS